MAKRLIVYAKELREDDYDVLRRSWQQAFVRDQIAREGGMAARRRINWPVVLMVAVGIIAAAGLFALLVS